MPGTTGNTLLDFVEMVKKVPRLHAHQGVIQFTGAMDAAAAQNGTRPKAVDFVVDMPLKLSALGVTVSEEMQQRLGRVVFALVEFQLQDVATFK